MSTRLFRFAVIALTALAVLAPLSLVFYQSFLDQPFFQPGAKLGLDDYEFVLSEEDFWTAFFTTAAIAAGMTVIAVPLGAVLDFLMGSPDGPAGPPPARAAHPGAHLRVGRGHCVRLRGGARPGRNLLHPGEIGIRGGAVESLFAALADRDRRSHTPAARLSPHRGGAARAGNRSRGGGARLRSQS